ncbi:MAG: T9SS type A sorting domain-containing protein [Candidatus Cloacimonetes bacterium]|nr:T9SS type A sorting domain-containing protein [Candidatus Cloacimonadota bacterium]
MRLMHFGLTELPTPVELSSFTATISAYNYIRLTWVTQTETGMRGYYVFRAPANDLANAQVVSPMIESMNSSEQQSYIYEDRELFESGTYYYWLQANDLDGSSNFHGPVSVVYNAIGDGPAPEIPFVTQLHSVYPNPFSPTVFIPFSLAKDGAVSIKIYNSRGQMVKDFDLGAKSVGQYRISWDGTDHTGKSLANGVYHITMSTDDQVYRAKAVLLR